MSSTQATNNHVTAVSLFTLSGFNAVVTGGGSGIGLMATQALAANGATVYIVGRRQDALQTVVEKYSPKIGGGKIISKEADISDKDAVKKLADEIAAEVGEKGIQVLCNNAGVAEEQKTTAFSQDEAKDLDYSDAEQLGKWLWRSEMEGWEKTFKTNVFAQFFVSAAFLPLLAKGTKSTPGYSSTIINTTSISGIMKGSSGGQFAYGTSKSAMNHLTQMLATMLVDTKVRVNAIAPAVFPSEMTSDQTDENQKSKLTSGRGKDYPAKRPGKDEDIAAAVLYLAGPGGVFINGQILHLDGGRLLQEPTVDF